MKTRFISLFIILELFVSLTESQLEFTMTKRSTKDRKDFPIESFTLIPNKKEPNSYKIEEGSLLNMKRIKDDLYTIKLSLGTPPQEFEVIVDTGSSVLWVMSSECKNCFYNTNKLDVKKTTSLVQQNVRRSIKYVAGNISGLISYERLNVRNSLSVPQFKFVLADNIEMPIIFDGILGLKRFYSNSDLGFSLINSLYQEGKIKRRVFSQKLEDGPNDSKFSIGTLPKEIEDDLPNFTKCHAITNEKKSFGHWACNLKQVLIIDNKTSNKGLFSYFFGNSQYIVMEKQRPVIFDTGANALVAPLEYANFFKNVYFKDFITNGNCVHIYDDTDNGFLCDIDTDINSLPKLKFILDNNISYEIDAKHFFEKNGDKLYSFLIYFRNIPGEMWLFSQPFLKLFHTVFDMDENTIGLYPKQGKGILVSKVSDSEKDSDSIYENNVMIYFSILYISGLALSLIITFFVFGIFRRYFGSKKVIEVDSTRSISLLSTESINNTL